MSPDKARALPCPVCKQYSHSLGEDQLAAAFNHFQSMHAHPVRGHPMGHNFDEATRDATQVLMAAIQASAVAEREAVRQRVLNVIESGYRGVGKNDQCEHGRYGFEDCIACYDEALLAALDGDHLASAGGAK